MASNTTTDHPTEVIHAALRRDYALLAGLINAGCALIMIAIEMGAAQSRYVLLAATPDTAMFIVSALLAAPTINNRMADRIRWESDDSYVRRQRIRIRCYAVFVVSSILFLGQMFWFALLGEEYMMLYIASFALSVVSLLWPVLMRPKQYRA